MVRSDITKRPCATSVPISPTMPITSQMRQSVGRAVPLTVSNTTQSRLPAPKPKSNIVQVSSRWASVDARRM